MLTAEQEKEIQEAENEVDITLIRWMLSLTPLERLQIGQQYAESAWRMKNAYNYEARNKETETEYSHEPEPCKKPT